MKAKKVMLCTAVLQRYFISFLHKVHITSENQQLSCLGDFSLSFVSTVTAAGSSCGSVTASYGGSKGYNNSMRFEKMTTDINVIQLMHSFF